MTTPTVVRIAAARARLESALDELAAVENDLDELTRYALALCRGDTERLVRRLRGLEARQAPPEPPEAT
jgi:hypothetical protein